MKEPGGGEDQGASEPSSANVARDGQQAIVINSTDLSTSSGPEPPRPSSSTQKPKWRSNTLNVSCTISLMEPVGSMSISPANRDVVLAARKGLFILDLEDPFAPPRFLPHMTTWEAVDIQWNPHPARSNWIASTSNQKLLIWNLDRPGDPRSASQVHRPPVPVTKYLSASSVPDSRQSALSGNMSLNATMQSQTSGTGASACFGVLSNGSSYGQTPLGASHGHQPLSMARTSAIEHVLHAHTRAITDINWSAFHPEILASCGIDTWTWVWDLRMSNGEGNGARKPAQGYSAWNAASTQVKWNRASPHRLASSCDNKVLIWDDRKGSLPLATIEAHESKIYGIDWSRDTSLGLDRLVTCSLDRTVKFWDLSSESAQSAIGNRELVTEPDSVIETQTPIWRARHLPFGNGVMTLPQRGDTCLSMWAKDKPDKPVATFEGHKDIVKEYLFRSKGGQNRDADDRQFQLITWSKDQTLRLWPVSEETTKRAGHRPGAPIRVLNTRAYAPDISYRDPPAPIEAAVDPKEVKGGGSIVTGSSILPPTGATRSLLSGRGSGSRVNTVSPYGSSISAYYSGARDIRESPVASFSQSYNQNRSIGKGLSHSSSHGNLGVHGVHAHVDSSIRPGSGNTEIVISPQGSNVAKSLPKYDGMSLAESSTHGPTGMSLAHHPKHFGFLLSKGPHSISTSHGHQKSRARPKESERARHGEQTGKGDSLRPKRQESKQKGRIREEKSKTKNTGTHMRLDRARNVGPAADPIGWIANVKMQAESGKEGRHGGDKPAKERSQAESIHMTKENFKQGEEKNRFIKPGEDPEEPGLNSKGLGEEIVALSRKFPRIIFEKVEVTQRSCTLSLYGPWANREPAFLRVNFEFPATYPHTPARYELERSANVSLKTRAYLLRNLKALVEGRARHGLACMEVCARFLIGETVQEIDEDFEDLDGTYGLSVKAGFFDTSSDTDDDEPRTMLKMPARRCGASFGPNGELVVFGPLVSNMTNSSGDRTAMPSRSQSKTRSVSKEAGGARFIQSYSALSNAMSSLARLGKELGGVDHGVRDSDVLQLMSTDFVSRRLDSQRERSDPQPSAHKLRRKPQNGVDVRNSDRGEKSQAPFAPGWVLPAGARAEHGHVRSTPSVVRIFLPAFSFDRQNMLGVVLDARQRPPLLNRRRSNSVPTDIGLETAGQGMDNATQGVNDSERNDSPTLRGRKEAVKSLGSTGNDAEGRWFSHTQLGEGDLSHRRGTRTSQLVDLRRKSDGGEAITNRKMLAHSALLKDKR
ncbi:WD40 repeat-like protein [Violaceomyces palustris]|uniref:WD40 repeat-like protein n=1 Tax=Violaceomyces palustris TaxID=1673888 RepID=A0ACD0NMU0_9BASI|nr:WD40 repeat-like protein [Violaceomyces palustris]